MGVGVPAPLTTDVSKMYRAIELTMDDRDVHRSIRMEKRSERPDYRMTFGVSASSFAANMTVKQNAIDHATNYPLAANAVNCSFYVDDGLTVSEAAPFFPGRVPPSEVEFQ